MFYLFSSDFGPRYKRNVLDILCYPEQQIFRFRYHVNHVAACIKELVADSKAEAKLDKEYRRKAVTVYAETTGEVPTKKFAFYPTREVEILRIQVIGNVYYVDVKFGKFIDYNNCEGGCLRSFHEAISQLPSYPLPPLTKKEVVQAKKEVVQKASEVDRVGLTWIPNQAEPQAYNGTPLAPNQGYFFQYVSQGSTAEIKYKVGSADNHKAWESVVEVLSSSQSMNTSLFYLIEGFYEVKRDYFFFGKHREYLIEPKNNNWETRYPLKMGKSVVLKLLFYRSENAAPIAAHSLEIKTEGDAFSGFSQKEIPLLSRYNEERLLIACRRVFDSVLAPIVIELKKDSVAPNVNPLSLLTSSQVATPWGLLEFKFKEESVKPSNQPTVQEVLAPNPFLLTQVVASRGLIFLTLGFLALASFLLFISPDYVQMVGWSSLIQRNQKPFGDWLVRNAPLLTQVSKIFGAICTLAAGYFGFRKLPLGK
jgi:hypothetical protein